MSKAQLINQLHKKDAKIESLQKTLQEPLKKRFDNEFFKNALAVLQKYEIRDFEDWTSASGIVERVRSLPRGEVRDNFEYTIYVWVGECTDKYDEDADVYAAKIMNEIFKNYSKKKYDYTVEIFDSECCARALKIFQGYEVDRTDDEIKSMVNELRGICNPFDLKNELYDIISSFENLFVGCDDSDEFTNRIIDEILHPIYEGSEAEESDCE